MQAVDSTMFFNTAYNGYKQRGRGAIAVFANVEALEDHEQAASLFVSRSELSGFDYDEVVHFVDMYTPAQYYVPLAVVTVTQKERLKDNGILLCKLVHKHLCLTTTPNNDQRGGELRSRRVENSELEQEMAHFSLNCARPGCKGDLKSQRLCHQRLFRVRLAASLYQTIGNDGRYTWQLWTLTAEGFLKVNGVCLFDELSGNTNIDYWPAPGSQYYDKALWDIVQLCNKHNPYAPQTTGPSGLYFVFQIQRKGDPSRCLRATGGSIRNFAGAGTILYYEVDVGACNNQNAVYDVSTLWYSNSHTITMECAIWHTAQRWVLTRLAHVQQSVVQRVFALLDYNMALKFVEQQLYLLANTCIMMIMLELFVYIYEHTCAVTSHFLNSKLPYFHRCIVILSLRSAGVAQCMAHRVLQTVVVCPVTAHLAKSVVDQMLIQSMSLLQQVHLQQYQVRTNGRCPQPVLLVSICQA
eukprot:11586-Heterococcus_DN1.PRE.2